MTMRIPGVEMTDPDGSMKRILFITLGFLLMAALGLTALALDGPGDGGGFSIEELPAFGEEDELFFPEDEETPTPEPTDEPTTTQRPEKGDTPLTEAPTPEEVGGSSAPSFAQEPKPDSTPAPEPQQNRAASGLRDNLPVMIVVAVLALSALAAALVKKRKATNRPPEAKRPNDIGGRK